ncbi:hypothetical protein LguiA_009339 [Lonicera macranthoides]
MSRSTSFSLKQEPSSKVDLNSLGRWVAAFCIFRFDLEQGQLVEECHPPGQRHDERLKRGGEQKSVVILSHSPYTSVFRPLLQIMGPLFFDIGKKALDHIAACVSMWPAPVPGQLMELPIGSATLRVNLPPAHSLPLDGGLSFEESVSSLAPLLPTNQSVPQGLFHDSDLFGTFRGLLLQLWVLWEMLLIGEPILIIAPTPPQCCEAVAGLVSLVAPLLFSVDFRPYFTIHDPEFAQLNALREGDTFPPMVLGVSAPSPNSSRLLQPPRVSSGRLQVSLKKFSPSSLLNAVKLRREGPLCRMTEHKEAIWSIWTSYPAIMKPDTSILNRLIDAGKSLRVEESMSVVNNEILRRHFLELTANFLAPFGRYFRAFAPSEGSSPFVDPPPLPQFNADEFLDTLSTRGRGKFLLKRMRSNWPDLYKRFLKGHNFEPWFQRKRAVAEQEQRRLWRQARMKADIRQYIYKMSELEIIDSFNAIEKHLLAEMQARSLCVAQESRLSRCINHFLKGTSEDYESTCEKLKGDLQVVFNVLPMDMQQLLLMNPQRAALFPQHSHTSPPR